MAKTSLLDFIESNREELIGRCREKVGKRTSTQPSEAEVDHGVPIFINQLCLELSGGPLQTHEISEAALRHGHDLRRRGFSIGHAVHDYGDVCQSITDLAVETNAPIGTEDFRTLNRCLDDAIAGAVTEFARERGANRDVESFELWNLVHSASAAFEAVRSGGVGVAGATGNILARALAALVAHVDAREVSR